MRFKEHFPSGRSSFLPFVPIDEQRLFGINLAIYIDEIYIRSRRDRTR